MRIWTRCLPVLLGLALQTVWAAPPFSGLLKGTVVTEGCVEQVAEVHIALESGGEPFGSIARTDAMGYFELDLPRRLPAWKPETPFTLHFTHNNFQPTVRNLRCSEEACEALIIHMRPTTSIQVGRQHFGPEVTAQRSTNCSTIFVLPHAAPSAAEHTQLSEIDRFTLEMAIMTHLQGLDLQPPTLPTPDTVNLVLLQGLSDLEATPALVKELGHKLHAMAMFYGIVRMWPEPAGTQRVPHITSHLLPITSLPEFDRAVNVLRRIPLRELIDNPDAYRWAMQRLARHTLFALVTREFQRVQLQQSHKDNFQRLQRLRAYLLAERKNLPQPAQSGQTLTPLQQRAEESDGRLLTRLLAQVEGTLDALIANTSP